MSGLNRKTKRKGLLARRKAAQKKYKAERDEGPCFVEDCSLNGDLTSHCAICDFKVQACTPHHELGRAEVKRHLFRAHPVKTVPRAMLAVLRGEDLE